MRAAGEVPAEVTPERHRLNKRQLGYYCGNQSKIKAAFGLFCHIELLFMYSAWRTCCGGLNCIIAEFITVVNTRLGVTKYLGSYVLES